VRRTIAFVLLVLTTASPMEAVAGELRDGEIHHETSAEASRHAATSMGDHGHEHGRAFDDESHDHAADEDDPEGTEHRHGTGSDHCTHAHGPALAAPAVAAVVTARTGTIPVVTVPAPSDHTSPPLHEPPRS
jgi:hypothetical protein